MLLIQMSEHSVRTIVFVRDYATFLSIDELHFRYYLYIIIALIFVCVLFYYEF